MQAAVAAFAALADPVRLRILAVLAPGRRCVCEIQDRVPIPANLLSYHLRILREAGLVEGNRRGRWIDYRLSDGAGAALNGALAAAGLHASLTSASGAFP